MSKWRAFWRSFHKNIIVKRKYHAFFVFLTDWHYRQDINRLYELTKNCTKKNMQTIDVRNLRHGHRVVYHKYAMSLITSDAPIDPVRVVFDPQSHNYVVVDGNHRLPALFYRAMKGETTVVCEVLS